MGVLILRARASKSVLSFQVLSVLGSNLTRASGGVEGFAATASSTKSYSELAKARSSSVVASGERARSR